MMFGNLIEIRGSKIDNVVEAAPPQTFIVIHIYDEVILREVEEERGGERERERERGRMGLRERGGVRGGGLR